MAAMSTSTAIIGMISTTLTTTTSTSMASKHFATYVQNIIGQAQAPQA
jgi:hypothetical protein